MAKWLDQIVTEEKLLHPGHAACAGCAPAINVRHVLDAIAEASPGSKIVLVIPSSCWTIIAGISAEQTPSIRLHEAFGFEKRGHIREVGHKHGQWLDVLTFQRMLA